MAIENDDELLSEIAAIQSAVFAKTKDNPEAALYTQLNEKLLLIKKCVQENNFSDAAKSAADMTPAMVFLCKEGRVSKLSEPLSAINTFFQNARIHTLSEEEAKVFFLRR